ncbi:MAG: hypothetical protein AB8B78_03670 [Polaribacter sp.]
MKKLIALFLTIAIFSSCLNNRDDINFKFEILPIESYTVPAFFTYQQKDTITIKYNLPGICYNFDNIYYEYQDTARIVAVRSYIDLDVACGNVSIPKEYKLIINARQREDYVFKFYKGKDTNDKSIFEEVVVPVN